MAKRKLRQGGKRGKVHSNSGIRGLALSTANREAAKKGLYLLFQDKFWAIYDRAKGNQIGVFYPASNMFGYRNEPTNPCKDWVHALNIAKSKIDGDSIG